MTGSDVIYATVGQEVVYTFSVSDNGTFTVTLQGSLLPEGHYSLDRLGDDFTFAWTPISHAPVSLRFVSNDTFGLTSQLHPLVRLCACNLDKNATCVRANVDGGKDRFILEDCECGEGWEGRQCCIDSDACLSSNCHPDSVCTDRPAPDTGFDCGGCPAGFQFDGDKCKGGTCISIIYLG